MIPVFFHTGYRYKNFDTEQAYISASMEQVINWIAAYLLASWE